MDISHLIERIDLTEQITGVVLGDQISALRIAIRGSQGAGRYRVLLNGEIASVPSKAFEVQIKAALYDNLGRVSLVTSSGLISESWESGIWSKFSIDSRRDHIEYNGEASKLRIWVGEVRTR